MTTEPGNTSAPDRRHLRVAAACGVFVACMVGASFAAVPLYDMFCRVTGFGGATVVREQAPGNVLEREIIVRFDGTVAPGLNWDFQPVQRQMKVKVGETAIAFYRARNRGEDGWGTASYNVTPEVTGGYFAKIACFCFTEQRLKAGEELDMPVQFFIDPSIAEDATLNGVNTITLSYTFFAAKPPASVAGAAAAPKL
ncbi:cytochrome c oxidase assembly protein [Flaviflagellibacter deserti]|uniref:Cytochrome c oxidase assembly protein CtaG n=1 Tax=Flaviflagellibacter deserti TaxID=2267266 RepID=A0ABV9YVL6_9HYPH